MATDTGLHIPECEQFVPPPGEVGVERILRIQGYTDMDKVRPAIRKAAQAMARIGEEQVQPLVCYRQVAIAKCDAEALTLADDTQFRSAAFARFLKEAEAVVLFVLTAGQKLDDKMIELSEEGNLLEALLLESAGWLCVEDITRKFVARLRSDAESRGQRITRRMGPGYTYKTDAGQCEWPLSEQAQLFDALASERLPVELLESGAMLPKMSRSGLFGLRPAPA